MIPLSERYHDELRPNGLSCRQGGLETSLDTPELRTFHDHRQGRVEEAARHIELDRLAISPQCGFASQDIGNPLTPEEQEAKLGLVVELAREIWGEPAEPGDAVAAGDRVA
jgi:hypothetical protein